MRPGEVDAQHDTISPADRLRDLYSCSGVLPRRTEKEREDEALLDDSNALSGGSTSANIATNGTRDSSRNREPVFIDVECSTRTPTCKTTARCLRLQCHICVDIFDEQVLYGHRK
jgi:hypothetical protein